MNIVRRLTTTVSSSFDWVISQIENHEALVNAAINEAQGAVSKARAQAQRVKTDGQKLRQRLGETRVNADLWQERALRHAAQDHERALECLRRRKSLDTLIAQLEEEERRHAELERQLSTDIDSLQDRIRRLKDQRNIMRTRESRATAAKLLGEHDDKVFAEIESIFERWESKVGEYESAGALREMPDQLEQECLTKEEHDVLSAELDALLTKSKAAGLDNH